MTSDQFIQSITKQCYQSESLKQISEFHDALQSIKNTNPHYYWWLEDSDFNDLDNLIQLIIQAPNEPIKYWLMGKLDLEKNSLVRLRKSAVEH